ncbi:MAG: Corrinoid/iron-sulfur protein small subunit [bacterium ADurb.Bin236]|nr:MAG: Corrinoid/iron-sulfur protein small subunit [bacterium ADurb.Bin236]HPN94737.1 acetyl-CoA decarbonylase/synthase complex subunit delta [bacterium]
MAFETPKINYSGKIREVKLGKSKNVSVGGESAYPLYLFEGENPNPPKIAMEVFDLAPEEWADAVIAPFKDVAGDPVAWAKLNVEQHGADMIALYLVSTDPNDKNMDAAQAAETAKKVAQAVDVPVIVYGTGSEEKDAEVLAKVAEACEGLNVIIGPVQEAGHKKIGAPCIGYKHTVSANTPIDVNLAKQLNILLGNLGVNADNIIIDPTTGGLGYGIEYTYSVIERIRMAALTQQDAQLQQPIISVLGREVWKCKEAKMGAEDEKYGDPTKRGILMEAVSAVSMIISGADIVVLRHPETVKLIKQYLKAFFN